MTQKEDEREGARQAALDALAVDRFADTAVNDIARMAADLCGTPVALVSMVDRDKQWFKARVGLATTETPREWAFCAHAIQDPTQVMVVEDTTRDPRFADNPLVTGEPNIRFYAGAPLVTSSGHALGTICVLDSEPRTLDPERMEALRFLAQQVVTRLEEKGTK
ncbi:MAG: GAF domain-containing protein [Caldimonas sp.]